MYHVTLRHNTAQIHKTKYVAFFQFANIKQKNHFPLDLKKKKKLKGSLFKCQNIPNRKTFCYMAEFQTNFENPF